MPPIAYSSCPVAALMAYLAIRGTAPGPFYQFQNGQPLSRELFVERVRKALREANCNPVHFAGHSFRIGAATTAAAAGIVDSLICTLGRWESSTYYLLYIKIPREQLAQPSATPAKATWVTMNRLSTIWRLDMTGNLVVCIVVIFVVEN